MHGRVQRRDNDVRVVIVDNGIGISEPQLIFEKFRQAGDTTTRKPQGTVLGLPICCRQIIGHLGGKLWVESGPGRGSIFWFNLPASIEAVTSKMVDARKSGFSLLRMRTAARLHFNF